MSRDRQSRPDAQVEELKEDPQVKAHPRRSGGHEGLGNWASADANDKILPAQQTRPKEITRGVTPAAPAR